MDKKYSVQEVAKLMMETETENENSDASDLVEFCDSTSESGSSSVLSDSCDSDEDDGDGCWKKWTRNVAPCSSLHLHVCCYIYVTIMLVIIWGKIVLYLVSNCVKGDIELDVDSPQQQQTLLQSDYDVEVAMEGDGEKKVLYKKNS